MNAIERGSPKLLTFGVSDECAWGVGLACSSAIKVFVEPAVHPEIVAAARGRGGEVIATVIEGAGLGTTARILEDGRLEGEAGGSADALCEAALAALDREASDSITIETPSGQSTVFLEVYPRDPRLVICGGTHVAVALVPLAKTLGYHTIVADGRSAFLARERFPDADELILGWPEEAFAKSDWTGLLRLRAVARPQVRRAGAPGRASVAGAVRRRHRLEEDPSRAARVARSQGLSEETIARVHGPIGLDLGGRHPAETALAILAEMTAVRYGGSARGASPDQPRTGRSRSSVTISRVTGPACGQAPRSSRRPRAARRCGVLTTAASAGPGPLRRRGRATTAPPRRHIDAPAASLAMSAWR